MDEELDLRETRAWDVPTGWKVARLWDYAYIKGRIGWRGLKAAEYTESGPYLIANKHIVNQMVNWEQCDHLSNHRFEESPEIQLHVNDVVMSKDGTIGQVALIDSLPDKATINSTMMLIRSRHSDLHSKFLFYLLQGPRFRRFIKQKVAGTSVPHIFQRDMKGLDILLPPLNEQRLIADIFQVNDRAIRKTDQVIQKAQKLKKGLMQRLLTKGMGHKEFKDTQMGEVPEHWAVERLDDLLTEPIRNGYSPVSPSQPTGKWVFALSALSEDGLRTDQIKPAPLDDIKVDQAGLRKGDILVSRSNTRELVGKAGMYGGEPPGCTYPDLMMRVRIDQTRVDGFFIENWLRHPWARRYLSSRAGGTSGSMVKINRLTLSSIPIPIPPLDEQKKIGAILSLAYRTLELERKERKRLGRIKDGLMDLLLAGKIRVRVA